MRTLAVAVALTLLGALAAGGPRLPAAPIPDGLGVNIHFTNPQAGEMQMMADAGITWVRMDFDWNQVEFEKGRYRFDAYDTLMAALRAHKMRPIFILDYVHRFYDDAQSPHTDEAIAAFAAFAAASATHFRGQGVLWEMYNEPNITPFWRPTVNVRDYIRLATATGRAIRKAAPGEAYIGAATSGIDLRYLEECFKGGLLELWDAVSVHPYRSTAPETVAADYARLRALIRRYAPRGKLIPIISGEWGYSSVWGGMDPDRQGKMLPRQWLTNIACDVPLSIWYDWHDDGPDPKEPEHHFGIVLHPTFAARSPIYDPKPAYEAAQTLTRQLGGFRFNKRLVIGADSNQVHLYRRGQDVRIVAWTTEPKGSTVVVPASPGAFEVVDHLGRPLPEAKASGPGLALALTDAPQYVRPRSPNPVLRAAADWERLPLEIVTRHRPAVRITASLAVALKDHRRVSRDVRIERSEAPTRATLSLTLDGAAPIVQQTSIVVSDPLVVTMEPPLGSSLKVRIGNRALGAFEGTLRVRAVGQTTRDSTMPFRLLAGQASTDVVSPLPLQGRDGLRVSGSVHDKLGAVVLALRDSRYVPVADLGAGGHRVAADGDPNIVSTQEVTLAEPAAGPCVPGIRSLRLAYTFAKGWKFVRVSRDAPEQPAIEGRPKAFGLWVHGDGKGNIPRLRFVDATGQAWQPDGDPIDWTGWRWVVFPLDGTRSGRWGGAEDGVIHYPIRWDTLFLLDSAGGRGSAGELHIAAPTLIY